MKRKQFPLWENDSIPASIFKDCNRVYINRLLDAINRKELVLIENHCLCHNEHEENDIIVSKKERYGLPIPQVLCSKCGLIRSGMVFDEPSNNLFYEKFYRGIYTTGTPSDSFFQGQLTKGKFILDLFERHSLLDKISNVAEIGCGAGGLLLPFQQCKKDVIGYDFDEEYLKYGRNRGINLVYGDFYKQAKDNSCDLVIMNHVFEHLLSPLQEIQKIVSKIKLDKYLYIQVPGIYCISKFYPDPLTYFQNAHVYNFYEQYFRVFFEKIGLKVIYGDERCTFICQKINNNIPNIDCVYDDSLSGYFQKNAEYFLSCKKQYDEKGKESFQKKMFNIACALGWKKIRPYVKRNKHYLK